MAKKPLKKKKVTSEEEGTSSKFKVTLLKGKTRRIGNLLFILNQPETVEKEVADQLKSCNAFSVAPLK